MFALKRRDLISPQTPDDFEELIAPCTSVLPTVTAVDDFFFTPANSHTQIDPAISQPIQGREFFRCIDGISLRYQGDAGCESQGTCTACQKADCGHRIKNPTSFWHGNLPVFAAWIWKLHLIEQDHMFAQPE